MKKLNGKLADKIDEKTGLKHYERINGYTGEIVEVLPEYSTMSRRPGIGHNFVSTFTSSIYPKDFTTIRGMRCAPPKYYDRYLENIDPDMYDDIKAQRQLSMFKNWSDNTVSRLDQKRKVKEAQFNQLKRSL